MKNEETRPPRRSQLWLWTLIFVITLVIYFPALTGDFLWDDAGHVTSPALQSWAGLGRIWFEPGVTQQYYPLLHSAFWLEHWLWGEAIVGYHLINVLLHATAACLVCRLLGRLAVPGAALTGLLFAVHPVCVESVAWISEQKNTLSAVLYFAAMLAYLRYEDTRSRKHHAIATAWFVAALLTKTVTATLPAVLLVLAWWRRGRLDWQRDVRPVLPWFALSLGAGALTAWFEQTQIGAQGSDFALGPIARLLLAGRVVWFYLEKLLWPANLVFIYPRWTIDVSEAWQWLLPLAAVVVLAALWALRRKTRTPLAVALLFVGTLFPALGFVNVFPFVYSYVADHFQYLASISIFAAVSAGVSSFCGRSAFTPRANAQSGDNPRDEGIPPSILLIGVVVLLTLGALTWRQAFLYRDVVTLYEDTLTKNPGAWMAHNNLGIELFNSGRPADALPHYEKAIALRPKFAEAENNLGNALNQLDRSAEARSHFERALQLQPRYAEAKNGLAIALMNLGHTPEGIAAFTEAIRLKPDYALAHVNLGLALARNNRPDEALPHFQRAAQLDPNYADAELNWGIALLVTNRVAEALLHFERAALLHPQSAEIHQAYGRALAAAGRYGEAEQHYLEAQQLGAPR